MHLSPGTPQHRLPSTPYPPLRTLHSVDPDSLCRPPPTQARMREGLAAKGKDAARRCIELEQEIEALNTAHAAQMNDALHDKRTPPRPTPHVPPPPMASCLVPGCSRPCAHLERFLRLAVSARREGARAAADGADGVGERAGEGAGGAREGGAHRDVRQAGDAPHAQPGDCGRVDDVARGLPKSVASIVATQVGGRSAATAAAERGVRALAGRLGGGGGGEGAQGAPDQDERQCRARPGASRRRCVV